MSTYINKIELLTGITQYTYWDDRFDVPLGIIWVRIYFGQSKKKIAICLNAMTAHYYKRKGVCTELFKALLNEADILLSASGSTDGGILFLKRFGFKYNKLLDIWCYTKRGE